MQNRSKIRGILSTWRFRAKPDGMIAARKLYRLDERHLTPERPGEGDSPDRKPIRQACEGSSPSARTKRLCAAFACATRKPGDSA